MKAKSSKIVAPVVEAPKAEKVARIPRQKFEIVFTGRNISFEAAPEFITAVNTRTKKEKKVKEPKTAKPATLKAEKVSRRGNKEVTFKGRGVSFEADANLNTNVNTKATRAAKTPKAPKATKISAKKVVKAATKAVTAVKTPKAEKFDVLFAGENGLQFKATGSFRRAIAH